MTKPMRISYPVLFIFVVLIGIISIPESHTQTEGNVEKADLTAESGFYCKPGRTESGSIGNFLYHISDPTAPIVDGDLGEKCIGYASGNF